MMYRIPAEYKFIIGGAVLVFFVSVGFVWKPPVKPYIRVAFVGNSMQYYNDMPRLMEEISGGHITQNSCLHGGSSFSTILTMGNGMYNKWDSGNARISDQDGSIHDFGACTVRQLLLGYDADLEQRVEEMGGGNYDGDDSTFSDDYFSYYDGSNPCLRQSSYYEYLDDIYAASGQPSFDYLVMNDNTRAPARYESRVSSLEVLESTYIPWMLETGVTPVLLFTYGYWSPYRDMTGLGSVPEFTSLTYEGYKQYAALLEEKLPASQKPRIAPVGLAFLIVWEEKYELWERLFHVDKVHCSPLGTFLQACVLHHTLFGKMPKHTEVVRGDMSILWLRARRFQPNKHRRTPFPTYEEAAYLYDVAARIAIRGHVPKTLVNYDNGEAADYTPMDDLYAVDDFY